MENIYDVGIANRYALFLEEGDNSLNVIKKKLSKEIRQQKKAIKKENTEIKNEEISKSIEKPKKSELKPPTNDVSAPKKAEGKENKIDVPKSKEKKSSNVNVNRKDKEVQDKSKTIKNGEVLTAENDTTEKETSKLNDNPTRKNFENRKPRERKNDNNESYQPKSFNNHYKRNIKDDGANKDNFGDVTIDRYHNDDNRNIKENGFGSHNDYRPRNGGRFRGGNRGSRGNYTGGDRKKDYDQRQETKEDSDTLKNDSWGDDKVETITENSSNQKDNENKITENEVSAAIDQKEVKEYLTLDEWKKLQGERQKPQYNLRKAGEGEDLTQWKNMRELQKKKDEKFLENGRGNEKNHAGNNEIEKENVGNENVQRVARQKHIDINVHFREPSTRGRGGRIIRSNRFGYKGRNEERSENYGGGEQRSFRKNREGYTGGRGNIRQNAPKMDDEHAFPSLG